MNIFQKKIRQIERADAEATDVNLAKQTSDKAVDLIKELSGAKNKKGNKIIDNVIVFTNASGGTGASTLVTNVAYMALQKKLKVLIIDLNILCPIQHAYLSIKQDIEKPDLVSYLLGKTSISESIDNSKEINLLFANNRTLNDEINCNNKVAIENFTQLIDKVRQYYDLVLVDCPMRVDEMLPNVMLYICNAIYMVWDESISSTVNTEKLRRNMALSGIDSFTKLRVIVNKRTDVHLDNSLRGKIFCEGGSATHKNSSEFARKIEEITDKILKIGGYVE